MTRLPTAIASASSILVTGGAGYVGSHVVLALLAAGRRPVVLDDLSTGRAELVPPGVPLVRADVADRAAVSRAIAEHRCAAVLHFAGSIVVPDSVADPLAYYLNNVAGSRDLIAACLAQGVHRFVFSSTATVYGEPTTIPIPEDEPTRPVHPYGRSKLMTEWMLEDTARASPLRYVALRYFNVAGADPQGRTGQVSPRATHLIKVAAEAALGRRPGVTIFGDDYPTPDGTCVRDYVHVADLAEAHVAALAHLEAGGESLVLNCGYGRGHSVIEVLAAVERAAGRRLVTANGPRRAGDVPVLVADTRRLKDRLGWRPRHDDLDAIVRSAIAWERRWTAGAERVAAT